MQVIGLTFNIPPPPIELHIQSEGGSAFAGIAAYDCIKACKTPVHTYIDGCAASAATLLYLAGKRRYLYNNSFMLIHQISTSVLGGKFEEFKDELKNQEKIMHTVKKIYLETSKMSEEELTELMKHDLWMESETIIKNGFADEII
jgi:ATP-dependent protease ClpP protease subunit